MDILLLPGNGSFSRLERWNTGHFYGIFYLLIYHTRANVSRKAAAGGREKRQNRLFLLSFYENALQMKRNML
jgi:hypothetical protein